MKLIAMKFRGVGPYKSEYAIDFAALTRSGMFLIDGETGAGKTTILDCLTFALYGNISGNEKDTLDSGGDGQRVRSRFLADSREETYVDLIFQSGDDYYEVRRTPKYDHPKANGEGMTAHNATGKLMRLDRGIAALAGTPGDGAERYFDYAEQAGHAEAITSRAGDVRPEITCLIGLNREQFSRTIMLAQGQFAMFLSLNPERRTELVENLFGAKIYEDIQNELAERRRTMKSDMERSGIRLAGSIATAKVTASRVLAECGVGLEGGDEPEILSNTRWGLDRDDAGRLAYPAREPDEIRETLHAVVVGVDAKCEKLVADGETANTAAGQALERARAHHAHAMALRDAAAHELRDLRSLHDVQADGPVIEQDRHILELADEARPIADLATQVESLEGERQRLVEQAAALQLQLESMKDRSELEQRREQALKAAAGIQAARSDLENADAHERLIRAAEQARTRHEQAKQSLVQARAKAEDARKTLDELPDGGDIEQELQHIAERLGGAQGLTSELEQANRILQHARQVERLRAELPELKRRSETAETVHAAAKRTLQLADAAIRQSGAAQYAALLEDGEPCPVCGSIEHPSPALAPDDVADAVERAELEQRVENKQAEAEQARAAVRDAERDLSSHVEHSEGLDVEQAEARIARIEADLAALDGQRHRQDALHATRQTIAKAEEALRQVATELAAAEAKAEAADASAADAAEQAQGYTAATVEQERADANARIAEAEARQKEAEQLKQAIGERDELERRYTGKQAQVDAAAHQAAEAQANLADALAHSGHFDTVNAAIAAGLDEREHAAIQQRIQRHEHMIQTAQTNLTRSRDDLGASLAGIDEQELRTFGIDLDAMETDADAVGQAIPVTGVTGLAVPASGAVYVAYTDDGKPTPLGMAIDAIDVDASNAAVHEAELHADETGRRVGALATLRQDWNTQAAAMEQAAVQWERQTARFAPLERMAALANGDKNASGAPDRLTLITYAVTERFRDVLDRANELLGDIQGGIYELRLVENASTGNRKTGLDITVFDRRTERTRNPGTLSGGETFFVSLALALALADIIQAENGGISMDTLFVDEGFGTLSEDYLSDVMDMLRRISRTRDVGIISHVDWLKDQIAERIEVSRVTPDGESRLEVIA